jgi:hypothetical protein
MVTLLLFSPERLPDLLGNVGLADSDIMQFALTHGGELTPLPAPLAP